VTAKHYFMISDVQRIAFERYITWLRIYFTLPRIHFNIYFTLSSVNKFIATWIISRKSKFCERIKETFILHFQKLSFRNPTIDIRRIV